MVLVYRDDCAIKNTEQTCIIKQHEYDFAIEHQIWNRTGRLLSSLEQDSTTRLPECAVKITRITLKKYGTKRRRLTYVYTCTVIRISNLPLYTWCYETDLINASKVWLFCVVLTILSIYWKKTCFHSHYYPCGTDGATIAYIYVHERLVHDN